jgi:hypothetical protein
MTEMLKSPSRSHELYCCKVLCHRYNLVRFNRNGYRVRVLVLEQSASELHRPPVFIPRRLRVFSS